MIFQQLFEPTSSTYTYLLADSASRDAVLIDPVLEHVDRYIALLERLRLTLRFTLETHVHADHVTAGATLRDRLGSKTVVSRISQTRHVDRAIADGDRIEVGALTIEVLATPGHTAGCVSYRIGDKVFTGDALMIGGNGRTDFQQGDAGTLFDSVTRRLYTLPDDTLVYPGHDYKGRTVSRIGHEKAHNERVFVGQTREGFIELMAALQLAHPAQMSRAVPANLECGVVQHTTPAV